MSLHENFSRYVYWPLAQKIKGERAKDALKELSESQWKSCDELRANQWRLVKKVVNTAIREVPYYRYIFREIGWDFSNTEFDYEEFKKIPLLEKTTLREQASDFLNASCRDRITEGKTSGSTGHSLSLFYGGEHESFSEAARWRAKSWWQVRIGSPHFSLWGRPYTGHWDRFNQSVKSYFMNTLIHSAFELNDECMGKLWAILLNAKPEIIYGYPSAIATLAGYAKKNAIAGKKLNLKVVMITAETNNPVDRALIEEVFECKTANEYGCSETGGFVYECPYGSWHISSELTFVEYIDKNFNPVQNGQTGEIVVTHLRNGYMPLIRYRVGDIGRAVPVICACGRGLPVMQLEAAKERDFVRLPNGERHTSEIFVYITKAVLQKFPSAILHFKVVQKITYSIEIRIVPGVKQIDSALDLYSRLLKKQLGNDIDFSFIIGNNIERDRTGKLRYFVSEIEEN
jgi:phenylacetate-CoA ligase